jgi:hypothetical protein
MGERLVSPDSRLWADALHRTPHDVYHLPSYARLCGEMDGGEARAFIAIEGSCSLLVPLIFRQLPDHLRSPEGGCDATVPYGYPGLLMSCRSGGTVDASTFLHRSIEAMVAQLRHERIVSAFFRLHPFLPVDLAVLNCFGHVVSSGMTVAIDLTLGPEARWRAMRANHRRDVTKAIAAGQMAEADTSWSDLQAFIEAYRETMARVGATASYLFPNEYFTLLRRALGEHLHLWTVRIGSEVAAGALFTECNGLVQYHLGGTLDRFLPGNPIKLLFHRASEWFSSRGNKWLHLGGGVAGASDSLLHFKLGFSPRTFEFHTWRLILDVERYRELLLRTGQPDAHAAPGSFFPPYRRVNHR